MIIRCFVFDRPYQFQYDPTNGTVSLGNIVRSGPRNLEILKNSLCSLCPPEADCGGNIFIFLGSLSKIANGEFIITCGIEAAGARLGGKAPHP